MKPATIVKTAIRALFAVPCALFLWVIYFAVGVAESLVCNVLQTIWSIVEKPCDFDPFGQTGWSPLATI